MFFSPPPLLILAQTCLILLRRAVVSEQVSDYDVIRLVGFITLSALTLLAVYMGRIDVSATLIIISGLAGYLLTVRRVSKSDLSPLVGWLLVFIYGYTHYYLLAVFLVSLGLIYYVSPLSGIIAAIILLLPLFL